MIPLLLMLAAAQGTPQTPIDAERAFAADARTIGQWTAFRKWSADDAVMFVPQPTNAHKFLKDRKDPPQAVDWWPTASYISCDGTLAVTTGNWQRPDGSVGYFTTVWRKQTKGGWKWIVDSGDLGDSRRDGSRARPAVSRASCKPSNRPPPSAVFITDSAGSADGSSRDGTLIWGWQMHSNGMRELLVAMWSGTAWGYAVWDRTAPTTPK